MSDELIGLIPAAGKGTRLGLPFPKELFPVIGPKGPVPAIRFALELLRDSGVSHTCIVISPAKAQLLSYLGDGAMLDSHLSYVIQGDREADSASTSPGLAHALHSAYQLTKGKTVCFAMADTIIVPGDMFRPMATMLREHDCDIVFGLFEVEDPTKFGMVDISSDGTVRRVDDKPKQTDLTLAWGCLCWSPRFTEHLRTCIRTGVADFASVLNTAIEGGLKAMGHHSEGALYFDLGTPDEVWRAQQWYHRRATEDALGK